ncbi:TrkH family potassium uptake protein [Sharpea azabuensis]|uniref:TrkH family potassium uptake protein n=1 Tax=Sharpea azabuensis TaxID=322505 RepID=UPI0008EE7989|nr:potassium transporter TrkG [Sharpea azabuensis]SFD57470.1 trk system potassium uptake protein TrkH [Sharpea azabuensis]SFK57150.1 trk system potassium uptake protein TrkH [Sharpea azabuensis]HAV18062.1 potassium uptake protein [Erysipelotrichaceae bacterium]
MEAVVEKRHKKKKVPFSGTKKIALSFAAVIFIGSILLSMPFANTLDVRPYIDNLYIAVSCVCVTGLTPFDVGAQYNLFGEIVMAILIQIGGLGLITFIYLILYQMGSKMRMKTKMVFSEALNADNAKTLPRLLKTIFFYTALMEIVGAIILSTVFVPQYGYVRGIYFGIWHAISGFCNAGFDLLGSTSLIKYNVNPVINFVIPLLIITGGIGFRVVLDLYDTFNKERHHKSKFCFHRFVRQLHLHSKLVLVTTFILLISGTILFLAIEYKNMATIGRMTFGQKLAASFFQSTTTRTAGFSSVPMVELRPATKIIMCILMFIGGSPASTAGGIKTVTFALVILMLHSVYTGSEETYVFHRRIKKRIMLSAFSIFAISLTICFTALILFTITDPQFNTLNLAMEVFSAFGTVGLSADVTGGLSFAGKIIDIMLMYTGRIGPVSLMILFTRKAHSQVDKEIKYPDEDVIVG